MNYNSNLTAPAGAHAAELLRTVRNINRDWMFLYDPAEIPDERHAAPDCDQSGFQSVALPHTWHTYETTGAVHPFVRDHSEHENPYWWRGWGWYRKCFVVNRRHAGRRIFLEFDGVQKYCRVFCNGRPVGEHAGGFSGFDLDITDNLRFDAENLLAVAVSALQVDPRRIPPMIAGNWAIYGGIYRDARLVIKHPVHIPYQGACDHEGGVHITTPVVSHQEALVRVATHIRNAGSSAARVTVRQLIADPDDREIVCFETETEITGGADQSVLQDSPLIARPRLWSPDSPALYTVHTALLIDGRIIDAIREPLGFRWFRWDDRDNALYLNDARVRLSGMNRHQEYPWLGDALPKRLHAADLRDMRENLGVNFARWCHYPQDKFVYDWCDRYGILVCEEVPNIKDQPFDPEIQRRQVLEMIRRDRNHPCIIMWSMGNETDNAADGRWARAEDPTRIIHYRKVKGPTPACDHSHANLDMENLLRCTVRGWWEPAAMDPDCAPLPPDHPSGQITGTEACQHAGARMREVNIRGRIDDDTVAWIYADHGAGRIYRHCPLKHINPKGWVDPYRQPKQVYWLWQANHSRKLMVHARDYFWRPAMIGARRDIVVDSNGESVALYVDEELIGERCPSRENLHSVVFEQVPVRHGILRAVARRGAETVEHDVPMSGAAAALRLRADPAAIMADRAGIALITLDVVDDRGVPVIGARPAITWALDGPGRLLAPEVFTSEIDRREALDGTFYTITPVVMPVRSRGEPGTIRVTASSPGLCSAEILVESLFPPPSPDDGILEPPLADSGDMPPARVEGPSRRAEAGTLFFADIETGSTDREMIRRRLWHTLKTVASLRRNDPAACALVEHLAELAQANRGVLIADDANFHLRRFIRGQAGA